jgi:hypothetical protein
MTDNRKNRVSVTKASDIDAPNAYYVECTDWLDGEETTYTVHTNAQGDGLWVNGRQREGIAQFSLRNIRNKAAKIRRYFE